jgi:hypothetical protein
MRLLTACGLTAGLLLSGCAAQGVTQAELERLRSDIRGYYEDRGATILDLKLNTADGEASGFVNFIEGGIEFTHFCTVTKYENTDLLWRCE